MSFKVTLCFALRRHHLCWKGVCGREKLDVRGAIVSFAYKRTSERWLLRDSDHFNIEDRRKQTFPYLLKDVKLAWTGSPALERTAGANYKHTVLTQKPRAL